MMKRTRVFLTAFFILMNTIVALALIPAAQAQTSGGCTAYHTVQRGETLYRIALRYGNSVAHLKAFNGIENANQISVGQRLCVRDNSLNPYPDETTYTVQRGDTLARIARQHGVTVRQLAQRNNLMNSNLIHVGQVLVIPTTATEAVLLVTAPHTM